MYLPRLPFTSRPPSPSPDIGCSPRPPRAADRRRRDPPCPQRHDGPAATPAGGGPMPWKPVSSSTPARHHSAAYRARGTWPAHCTTRDPWTGHCRRGCRTGTQLHSRLRGQICTGRQSGADSPAKRPRARRARARSSMDRATGFYPVGWGFESLRAHHVAGQEAVCGPGDVRRTSRESRPAECGGALSALPRRPWLRLRRTSYGWTRHPCIGDYPISSNTGGGCGTLFGGNLARESVRVHQGGAYLLPLSSLCARPAGDFGVERSRLGCGRLGRGGAACSRPQRRPPRPCQPRAARPIPAARRSRGQFQHRGPDHQRATARPQ